MHRVQQFMRDAFDYFVEERISRFQCPTEVHQMSANELRRLLDLQLPQWVLLAPADARFSRSLAVEQSIAEVDHRAGSIWPVALSLRAQCPAGHTVTITLSDRKQFQEMFFSWVRRRCADALSGPQPEVFPAPAADTVLVWDHISKGLTYHFQAEIARANEYLRHLVWFEHRAGTCLDGRLRVAKFDLTTMRTALQMGRASGELVLPKRETGEVAFFSCIEGSRGV